MFTDDEIYSKREDFAIRASTIILNLTDMLEKIKKIEDILTTDVIEHDVYKPLVFDACPPKKRIKIEKI